MSSPTGARFALGQLVSTPGALAATEPAELATMLRRHVTGDWGELCDEDKEQNDQAITHGNRIMSAYTAASSQQKIWVITERDRSVTTFLLPSEY